MMRRPFYRAMNLFLVFVFLFYGSVSTAFSLENCNDAKLRALGVVIVNCTGESDLGCDPVSLGQNISPGSKIYLLGDSILVGAKDETEEKITTAGFVVSKTNADGGRAITYDSYGTEPTGLEAVTNDSSLIADSQVVVVELGTNSGNEELTEQVPILVDAIRATGFNGILFWVNTFYTSGGTAGERNTEIQAQSLSTAKNFTIIDAYNAGIELGTDRTHPTAAGEITFAETITKALTSYNTPVGGGAPTGDIQPIVGGASLDGNPMHVLSYPVGLDEQKAAGAIDSYINSRKPESPFVGLGSSFVAGAKKYNVNPFLPVGHIQKENGFATATGGWHSPSTTYATSAAATAQDSSQKSASFNAFGREGSSSQPRVYYKTSSGRIRTPFKWSTWAASLDGNNGTEDPWFALINRRYLSSTSGFKIASGDFETYISHYAPQGDGNNEADYVSGLKDAIDGMVELMGAGVSYSGGGSGGCGRISAGANGWGLPGEENPMIFYSQLREESPNNPKDPAVTSYWGNSAFGAGKISECGCGPTSFAMVVATLKNDTTVTPENVAAWASENGYRSSNEACAGSSWWWVQNSETTLAKWGVVSRQVTIDEAPSLLKQGLLIIMSVGPGSPFLSEGGSGHLLVMRAVTDDGKFLFADPSDAISKRLNGGDNASGIDTNIFNGTPAGSSHTAVDAAVVSQGLNGLFVVEVAR